MWRWIEVEAEKKNHGFIQYRKKIVKFSSLHLKMPFKLKKYKREKLQLKVVECVFGKTSAEKYSERLSQTRWSLFFTLSVLICDDMSHWIEIKEQDKVEFIWVFGGGGGTSMLKRKSPRSFDDAIELHSLQIMCVCLFNFFLLPHRMPVSS